MKKSELRELYQMMFPDYPDIVTVAQLQSMLGISRCDSFEKAETAARTGIQPPPRRAHGFRDAAFSNLCGAAETQHGR